MNWSYDEYNKAIEELQRAEIMMKSVPLGAKPVDVVNNPPHYNLNHKGIECIDAMEAMLTPEEFTGYLRGNIFKYQWRYKYKNGKEDLDKAAWYSNKLAQVLENNPALYKG